MRHNKFRVLVCAALRGIAQGPARSQTAATLYGVADPAAYQRQLAGEKKLKLLQSGGIFRTAALLRHSIEKRQPNPIGLGDE